ncbi:hypothetical protein G6F68_018002 [Rhizopus microsporus]|nr:hypothetical protein G6F68_018002 [Rhizopus microsporus]
MIAVVIDACAGVASAFAPEFTWLLFLRFLTGIGVGGTLPVDYTMMAEFLPSDRRGRWLVLLESFWAVGTIFLALLALGPLALPPFYVTLLTYIGLPPSWAWAPTPRRCSPPAPTPCRPGWPGWAPPPG